MLPRPGAADLLEQAQQAFQDHVAQHLQGEAKFAGAMIARVMAIAQAELRDGPAADALELKRIQALYDEPIGDDLTAARKKLAADIRARKFEPGTPRENRLLDGLTSATATRLRAVNVKYMSARARGGRAESSV
jgi:hypothetical protein